MLASDFNTLLYPLILIDLGLKLGWLYSAEANLTIVALFLIMLIVRDRLLVEKKDIASIARLALMLIGSLSFGAGKLSTILFGYPSPLLIESARFIGATLLLIGAFCIREITSDKPLATSNRI